MRTESDLENVVLGIVWSAGRATAYRVRKTFIDTPSSHWSGSPGSIYPLMQRLEQRGMLESRAISTGQREAREYTLSKTGLAHLREWASMDELGEDASITYDPVRARVFFLGALESPERRPALERARDALLADCERHEALVEQMRATGKRYAALGSLGAALTARARVNWIEHALCELEGE